MEYKIIRCKVSNLLVRDVEKAIKKLEGDVNDLLRSGWEPAGGVAFVTTGSTPYVAQAVVRSR